MASIKKRDDGKWRARYRDETGKEHAQHFATRALGQAWLDRQSASLLGGEHVDPKAGKVRFGDYADEWLKTKADVAASTMGNVKGRLHKHAKPFFESMQMSAARPTHARAFVADLVSQGLAPSTVKGIVLTTAQVFAQAVDDGIIARSPFAKVSLPSDRHREEMRFLTPEQVNSLAANISERHRTAIYLAAYGGLRAGELWALTTDRVNVLARTVEIAVSASEASGWHVGPTKTGKHRTITVPRFLAKMLAEHIGRYPSADGFVFTAAEGGPIHHRNFRRRQFHAACIKSALGTITKDQHGQKHYEGVRFHDLRHTCAALLIANGRHMEEVKDYLGHSSIRVTSDRYGHLFPKARAELADSLENTFQEHSADFSRTSGTVTTLPNASEGRS
jgi:integrase